MMGLLVRIGLVLGLLGISPPAAEAHFLFIQIGPHAEAGRNVEVFFSERATAGDPQFVAKVAHTELWMQDEPGKFTPLKVNQGTDRLRAYLPSGKSVAVVGRCEYGVLKRDKSFLLRYYPKAISGQPDELAKLKRHESIPLEILASVAGDTIAFTVLNAGQPLPGAVLTTIDAELTNLELKTDATGRAEWKPGKPGQYAVYVKHVTPQAGERGGQSYEEVREFATLAFDWPLGVARSDAAAIELFEQAITARAGWPNFRGFKAQAQVYLDGRNSAGQVTVKPDGEVSFAGEAKLEDEAAQDWVRDQLHSMVIHRVPTSGIRSTPVLSFADEDTTHPQGRLLTFHGGRFASSYRVRGDEITVVNRNIGPENMSILVLETERNPQGKVLPRAYLVQYRNAQSGALERVETFQNRWQRIGELDLPQRLSQTVSNAGGVSVRRLELQELKLLE